MTAEITIQDVATESAPSTVAATDVAPRPMIELLGQSGAGCCGGGACAV